MAKKKQTWGFRYDTGSSRIAWDAVGEKVNPEDIAAIVQFLLPKGPSTTAAYNKRLKKVKDSIADLSKVSDRARNLSLGNCVRQL